LFNYDTFVLLQTKSLQRLSHGLSIPQKLKTLGVHVYKFKHFQNLSSLFLRYCLETKQTDKTDGRTYMECATRPRTRSGVA